MPIIQLDRDFVYPIFKCGDQEVSPLKPANFKLYNGMCIDIINPRLMEKDKNFKGFFVSEWQQKCAAMLAVPIDQWEALIAQMQCIGELTLDKKTGLWGGADTFRRSGLWLNMDEIQNAFGVPNLKQQWLSKDVAVDVLDCSSVPLDFLKEAALIDFSKSMDFEVLKDENAVTSGSYTVGSGGGDDYASIPAAWADAGNLTGNLTFNLNSNLTQTAAASIGVTLGGYTFKQTSASKPLGSFIAGYAVSLDASGGSFVPFTLTTEGPTGVCEFADIRMLNSAGNFTSNTNWVAVNTVVSGNTFRIHDMVQDARTAVAIRPLQTNDVDAICEVWNNKAVCSLGVWYLASAQATSSKVENNSIMITSNQIGISGNSQTVTYQNNLVIRGDGATGSCYGTVAVNAIGNCNAGTDATADDFSSGSGSIINLDTPRAIFSRDDTRADFLECRGGAGLLNRTGVTCGITSNIAGCRGNTGKRTTSTPCIGADEATRAGNLSPRFGS